MLTIRQIHDEIMTDLCKRGFNGYVEKLHDYKNDGTTSITKGLPQNIPTSIPNPNNKNEDKNKNESPADCILLNGGASSPLLKVIS